MSTSFARNGHADYDDDWQAALDYAAGQRRYAPWHDDAEHTDYHPLRDQRHACGNPECSALTDALFCSEECREHAEGPDHVGVLETEEEPTTAEPSRNARGTGGVVESTNGASTCPFPEAPASATVRLTIAGYADVLFTMRDLDEHRLLARLETLLQRFPLEPKTQACTPPTPSQTPVCTWHGAMKESVKAPGTWYCPNKMADGSYCQERWPAKNGGRR
jgi:hypothetical protein